MGAGTYSLLICLAAAQHRKFKPDLMTTAVSTTFAAWSAHTILLKVPLHYCTRLCVVSDDHVTAEHRGLHQSLQSLG